MREPASNPAIQSMGLLTCEGKQASAWSTLFCICIFRTQIQAECRQKLQGCMIVQLNPRLGNQSRRAKAWG